MRGPFAALVLLLLLAPAWSRAEPQPRLTYESTARDGAVVFRVSDPSGIRLRGGGELHGDPEEMNTPFAMAFVTEDGRARPVRTYLEGGDAREAWVGSDVAYLSAADIGLGSPTLEHPPGGPYRTALIHGDFPETSGYLVVTWARQPGPVRFEFWERPQDAVVVAESTQAAVFDVHQYREGASVGAYPVGHAHVDTHARLDLQPGEQAFSWLTYRRGGAVGQGELKVTSDDERLVVPLDALYDPREECICASSGMVLGISSASFEASLTYVGESRTRVFLVSGILPERVLPEAPLWHEPLT